jgi:WD40 repeat protein
MPFYTSPTWNFDGDRIALNASGAVLIYDVNTGNINELSNVSGEVYAFAWSSDSNLLAATYGNGNVEIWNAQSNSRMRDLELDYPANVVAWLPNNLEVLTIGGDTAQNLSIWNVLSGVQVGSYRGGSALNVEFDQSNRYLALHTSLSLYIVDAQTYTVVTSSPRITCCTNQMSTLAWSQDGSYILTGSINGLLTIWDTTTLTPLHQLPANPYFVQDSRDVPDLNLSWVRDVAWMGNQIVQAVSGDGTLRQWSINGDLLQETQIEQLDTASWSPFGARLAVQRAEPPTDISNKDASLISSDAILEIMTTFASAERLQAIAAACGADQLIGESVTDATLPDVITELQTMTDEQIPPACAADLLAIAQALSDMQ